MTQDQIIHGTYSYEKERILYGAHSAAAASVFGQWKGQGKVFYKVASQVLSPRFFKDSEDIGTISVRYVVQDAGPNAAILQVDAVFVDARNVRHPSLGNVESSEYAAIQERLKNIQTQRKELELGTALDDPGKAQPAATHVLGSLEPAAGADALPAAATSVPDLRKQIDALRRQVELRVKDEGAQLKSAPFHGAATLTVIAGRDRGSGGRAESLLVWSGNTGRTSWLDTSQPVGAAPVNHVMDGHKPAKLLIRVCLWVFLSAYLSAAQSPLPERTFHCSKADVLKALHDIPSYPGGKLPVLDGFASPSGDLLENYKRGYYEYDVQVRSPRPGETTVRVSAKITAWYGGASSGYRLLKSSGRLESDLLDALDDKLNPGAAARTAATPSPLAAAQTLPDDPSATSANRSFFNTPRLTSAPSSAKPAPAKATDPNTAKRLQELTLQEKNLEAILHEQARPNNLAIVKRSNTPLVAQPLEGAEVLFQCEAEDEFEVLDTAEGWVHVKISGISRGWIKRQYVDLPGAATVSPSAIAADQQETDIVRQTKQEVGAFPGKWEPLDGKRVEIIWVQPPDKDQFGTSPKWAVAKTVFRKAEASGPPDAGQIAGVVVIFDSVDGGMAATTLANLQQWRAGHLSDDNFWRRCWRDPAEAFQGQN